MNIHIPVYESVKRIRAALLVEVRSATFVGVQRHDSREFFELFADVLRHVRKVVEDGYADIDCGSAQAKLIRHIGAHSQISQAQLARGTDTAPTLTGRALESLIKRGWVRRKRSEEDRREYVLELTASGKRARERVEAALDVVAEQLARALDDRDADDFERIAAKILSEVKRPSK
jgi:DNA-binding MarR family transcriptional regulator